MTTGGLALLIMLAILAQVAAYVLWGLYRRGREYRRLDQRPRAPVDAAVVADLVGPDAGVANQAVQAQPAWSDWRSFVVDQRQLESADESICSFYLKPADGQALPAFRPGQFLTFKLPVSDPGSGQLKSIVRCYSLSDAPRSDRYRVTIKRVPAPPQSPDLAPGLASNHWHDQVSVGSQILVKPPAGHFHLLEAPPLPLVLIGGGIGITPMLSIVNTVLESGRQRDVWLFYGVRNGREQIMREHLRELARRHTNLRLFVCFSNPGEQDQADVDFQHQGRIDVALLRATLPFGRYQFYVCGPKPMMESVVPGLQELGVDPADIHYESFGPASLNKAAATATPGPARSVNVSFSRSGRQVAWDNASDSLLALAETNGIEVESGCRAGSCGSCATAISAGTVEYNQQADAEIAPGHCLLCIARPTSDLVLEA